jgi:UDP-N-acetyl-D-galactosamine dehydrogenase
MSEVVAIVGAGYVRLALAVEFGKRFDTIGYDLSVARIDNNGKFCDPTGVVVYESTQ